MKRIEDENELKEFDKSIFEFNNTKDSMKTWREECEFFFRKGRESMAKELCTAKPKRTIAEYHRMDDSFFVISNDRKMFHWQGNQMGWYALSDLPQD